MELNIEDLVGHTFYKKKGHNEKDRETLFNVEDCGIDEIKSSSFLGLLFSAHWCPPCQSFLSILKEFYSEVNIDKKKCEILLVSTDKSEVDYREHYAHMPWLALPFQDNRIQKLL
jgi:nucleoredoxin